MSKYAKACNKKGVGINQTAGNLVFDSMIQSKKSGRPTAAKSAGIIGKWGVTSFTSLRHVKSSKQEKKETKFQKTSAERKFFKSRVNSSIDMKNGKNELHKTQKENHNIGKFVLKARFDPKDGEKVYSIEPFESAKSNPSYPQSPIDLKADNAFSTKSLATPSPLKENALMSPANCPEFCVKNNVCKPNTDNHYYHNDKGVCDNSVTSDYFNSQSSMHAQELKHSRSPVQNDEADIRMSKLGNTRTLNPLQYPSSNHKIIPADFETIINNYPQEKTNVNIVSNECVGSPDKSSFHDKSEKKDVIEKCDSAISSDKPKETVSVGNCTAHTTVKPENVVKESSSVFDDFQTHSETETNSFRSKQSSEIDTSSMCKSKRIFSSRNDSVPKRATYKHKWHDDNDEVTDAKQKKLSPASAVMQNLHEIEPAETLSKLVHVTTLPETDDFRDAPVRSSRKCLRKEKKLYQVVKNVKNAHQIQESGEYQEFNDDVEFLFDALQDNNQIITRCLSCVSLASKCMKPAFRMHLRAHGTVIRFFNALHDAPQFPSLALCTSLVMFVLSQDRLNMDLDPKSLDLMLQLLDSDASHVASLEGSQEMSKIKRKVVELCTEMRNAGHAKLLNFDSITAGYLAMETLLSLTSKRAGEWFKEEVRELGGLDHIISTVQECMKEFHPTLTVWDKTLLDKLGKADRCLRVLENVLHENEENQLYLLKHKKNVLLHLLINLYNICIIQLPSKHPSTMDNKDSVKWIFMNVLFTSLKVLINLTHDYGEQCQGSTLAGKIDKMYSLSMIALFELPIHLPDDKKFDIHILALSLLINLVEHSSQNRKRFLEMPIPITTFKGDAIQSSAELFIRLFFHKQESARIQEAKTDNILDGKKDDDDDDDKTQEDNASKSQEEVLEETIKKLLQKAGKHMEDTLIATYIVLLLGYVMMDCKEYQETIKCLLPDSSLQPFLEVLNKFYNFENLAPSVADSVRGLSATKKMLKFLEELQHPKNSEENSSNSKVSVEDTDS